MSFMYSPEPERVYVVEQLSCREPCANTDVIGRDWQCFGFGFGFGAAAEARTAYTSIADANNSYVRMLKT